MSFNLFGKSSSPVLPEAAAARLLAWQSLPPQAMGLAHYQTRYVVLDISTSGLDPDQHELTSIAAVGVSQGRIRPSDACWLEGGAEGPACWLDLLAFIGKAPLVSYQLPFVSAFLEPVLQRELGLELKLPWLDLANLLPELFRDAGVPGASLEAWLAYFDVQSPDGLDAMANALAMARLLQRLLLVAKERGVESPGALLEQAKARRWLHGDT